MSFGSNANKVKKLILAIVLMSWPICGFAQTYSTSFPLTENPISERGKWVGGQSADGNLWGNVQTSGGMAYGVSQPTTYGDPTAILTGSWAANQQAQVTVKIDTTPTVCCHEIEVRLRMTISAKRITGYEVYCSVVPGNKYCHIARWSGPDGLFCNIEPSPPSISLVNGDVLMGTVTGSNPALITAYLNGVQIMQVSDTGNEGREGTDCGAGRPVFTSGSPGIGFYDNRKSCTSMLQLALLHLLRRNCCDLSSSLEAVFVSHRQSMELLRRLELHCERGAMTELVISDLSSRKPPTAPDRS